jgi:putative intracellular protease/amidase
LSCSASVSESCLARPSSPVDNLFVPIRRASATDMAAAGAEVLVGVLALQGSFREHVRMVNKLDGASAIEVRTKEELSSVDGLIIPGGESTTMALIAQEWGLLTELQEFAKTGRPIWGTCAGLIFLAKNCTGLTPHPSTTTTLPARPPNLLFLPDTHYSAINCIIQLTWQHDHNCIDTALPRAIAVSVVPVTS